ncbi:MAG: 5'-methylthioadenosine/S-adenosylhomocysteine nucleosidase, partial [Bacteroidales bacterium]|nr:5'-methylthioadenosine/S-adenosylhomocysteine nucleosidase [Bacteroidales bacterium]
MKAGLIVAMEKEYQALKRAGIESVQSGMGKTAAAMTATELILRSHPDCIINSGCAGGLADSLNVLDVVVGTQTAYHDVWCGYGNQPGQVQGQPSRFFADPTLLAAAQAIQCERPRHFGLICSGDQFITSPQEEEAILSVHPDALACDMESAAIAQVCFHYVVPFLSFRIISDVRHSSSQSRQATYESFWESVSESSFSVLSALLE